MKKPIREIRIEGNVAFITLTKGYTAVIDAADVHLVDGFNWTALVQKGRVYAYRKDCSSRPQRNVRLHRAVMGEPEGLEVDHRDGDGLNNRRKNLRVATPSQNRFNQRRRKNNTSGYKGVTWDKRAGKWAASIVALGRKRHLGYFNSASLAHAAYVSASAKHHGDFGRHN